MTFNVFDSISFISRSNSYFFGFSTFKQDFFQVLQLGFQCYNNSRYKKTGVDRNTPSLRDYFEAVKGFYRRQHDVDVLQQESIWKNFSHTANHNIVLQQQLEETREKFQHHARFSTHSNESLYEAYKKLNGIEKLLLLAQNDIERAEKRRFFGRIPKSLLAHYKKYSIEQLAILRQERQDIVLNIVGRLIQAAKDPLLENTDTLLGITEELKQKGFLKSSYKNPAIADDSLSKTLFYKFHGIIRRQRNHDMLAVLHSLPWFRHKKSLASRYGVSKLVPKKHKKPEFIFFNTYLRQHWFDDFHPYAKIDATLHYLKTAHVTETLTSDSFSRRIIYLRSADYALSTEIRRIRQARIDCQKGLRKYFNAKTMLFLDAIEANLHKHAIKLINHKINVLHFISVAPREEMECLNIQDFIISIYADITPRVRQRYDRAVAAIQEKLEVYYEEHLNHYLCQWSSVSQLKNLRESDLIKLNREAEEQETLLMRMLPRNWSVRIKKMQLLRQLRQFQQLESSASSHLKKLIAEKPAVLQKIVTAQFQYLYDGLVEYIKNYIKDFNYGDQKNVLSQMIKSLQHEGVTESEFSTKLSKSERLFLKQFPEINFFINATLKLHQEQKIIEALRNPSEIEAHIDSIYRFILFQEAKFLNTNKVKFVPLYCNAISQPEKSLFYHCGRIIR